MKVLILTEAQMESLAEVLSFVEDVEDRTGKYKSEQAEELCRLVDVAIESDEIEKIVLAVYVESLAFIGDKRNDVFVSQDFLNNLKKLHQIIVCGDKST